MKAKPIYLVVTKPKPCYYEIVCDFDIQGAGERFASWVLNINNRHYYVTSDEPKWDAKKMPFHGHVEIVCPQDQRLTFTITFPK